VQNSSQWSDEAVRDTVAEIVRQAAYQQSISDTLWARVIEWIARVVRRLFELFAGSDNGRIVVAILFAVLVFILVVRLLIGIRANRDDAQSVGSGVTRRRAPDLLAEADRLANAGDYISAAHALCAALLESYAARGDVRLHRSKTTGDYARELRRKQVRYAGAFQSFRLRYDRLVYGSMSMGSTEYQELATAAREQLAAHHAA
jgi:hypothetical protein